VDVGRHVDHPQRRHPELALHHALDEAGPADPQGPSPTPVRLGEHHRLHRPDASL